VSVQTSSGISFFTLYVAYKVYLRPGGLILIRYASKEVTYSSTDHENLCSTHFPKTFS
jgi:hypothetical protein